jgi:hypothetical protein
MFYQRGREAIRMINVFKSKAPFNTKISLIVPTLNPGNLHNPIVFDVQLYLATNATIRADSLHFSQFPVPPLKTSLFFSQCAGWASLKTGSTRDTVTLSQWPA